MSQFSHEQTKYIMVSSCFVGNKSTCKETISTYNTKNSREYTMPPYLCSPAFLPNRVNLDANDREYPLRGSDGKTFLPCVNA